MSAAPEVLSPQNGNGLTGYWQGIPLIRTNCEKALGPPSVGLMNGDVSSSGDELNTKVRKPYTITKQRERWTEDEHQKFLDALKLYGRAWRRIEEHIGTKTAVQIRSHAQKFFSKLEREASNGGSTGKLQDIEIPPPRPKRKPNHPYPRKADATSLSSLSPMDEESRASPVVCPAHTSAASSVAPSKGICQPAAFTPYSGKRGPTLDATILHNNALGSAHFLGPEGQLKLFGKTVLVPTSQKTAVQEDFKEIAIKEKHRQGSLAIERILPASQQTVKADLKHKTGFLPYVKAGKKHVSSSVDGLSSDINASGSGISTLEGTDESNMEIRCMPVGKVQCTENLSEDGTLTKQLDTNLQSLSRRQSLLQEAGPDELFAMDVTEQPANNETLEMNRDSCENVSNKDCVSHTNSAAANMGKQFPAMLAPQNNAAYLWMDSLFRYYCSLPPLSLAACGSTDGQSNCPNIPWHFLQAAAMTHPAAYAAAIATAGWTQLMSGGQTPATKDIYNVSNFLDDVSGSAFTAAAASWWAMRGLVPLGLAHPLAGAISKSANDPGSGGNVASGALVQNLEILADTVKQQQDQMLDTSADDQAATSEINTEPENEGEDECIETNKPGQEFGTLESKDGGDFASSATAASVGIPFEEREIVCEAKTQCKVERPDISTEADLPIIGSQKVDKPKSATEQSPCSSADEIDTGEKNPMEGSSSGSNTPLLRHHTSESETPHTSGSDVKGKDDFSKQLDTCDDATRHCNQDNTTGHCNQENQSNGSGCPKMRFKHMEKGRKHQHKDFRPGDDDSVKRFKSCAHDMDLRKEVSQEGRKAFQALFTCRTLPQTFPSVLTSVDTKNPPGTLDEDVVMDSATVDVDGVSCLLTRSEREVSGCIENCGSLLKTMNDDQKEMREGEARHSGFTNVVSTSITCAEMGASSKSAMRQYLSISKEVDATIFSVGSRLGRSGFLPYQRPIPKIHPHSHSAPSPSDKKHSSQGSGVQNRALTSSRDVREKKT